MRHGVTRDARPFAPPPDACEVAAIAAAGAVAQMAMKGMVASRVADAARALFAAWRAEPISRASLRRRLELLQAEVDDGLVAVEDYIATAEEVEECRQAEAQHAAVKAIREVLTVELRGLRLEG